MTVVINPGPVSYPTPLGEIHVDRKLDEITLVDTVEAIRRADLELRQVYRVALHADGGATVAYFQFSGGHPMIYNDEIVRATVEVLKR